MNKFFKIERVSILQGVGALVLLAICSCYHFYRISTTPRKVTAPDSLIVSNPSRYFILRSGLKGFQMSDIVLSQDRKSLSCLLKELPQAHRLHLSNGRQGNLRFKSGRPEAAVLNEIHLYTTADSNLAIGKKYVLQFANIIKIEVLEKNNGRTIQSYVLGGAAVTVGVVIVAAVIVAATKSSCPFVSAYDGSNMVLQGELYGGAIYPQLTRNDYMELKMKSVSPNHFNVKISNELKERQFTDVAELVVVTHNKDVQILTDQKGNLYSISQSIRPLSAANSLENVLSMISQENDNKYYCFNDTVSTTGVNQLTLVFSRPQQAKRAKLILRLKNSYWMDVAYEKMNEGFGRYFNSFVKSQRSKPASALRQWMNEQCIPLSISMKTDSGSRSVIDLNTTGPLAARKIVVPLDLNGLTGNELQLQLSTGFMFWEIDYAAIDYSEEARYSVSTLTPSKATDETGRDVTKLLTAADGRYLEQPVPGNVVDIDYIVKSSADSNQTQTFFLHSKGYYEHVRNYQAPLNLSFLKQFKEAYGLSKFSQKLYKATLSSALPPVLAAQKSF